MLWPRRINTCSVPEYTVQCICTPEKGKNKLNIYPISGAKKTAQENILDKEQNISYKEILD